MTITHWLPAAAIIAVALGGSARAQDSEAGRFRLERTDQGFVRLDTRSGALSLCQDKDGNLVCRMAADERAAYEEELGRLEKRVTALEDKAGGALQSTTPQAPLPSDAEVERSIGIMERFMRSFFGLVEEFKDKDPAATAAPDKT